MQVPSIGGPFDPWTGFPGSVDPDYTGPAHHFDPDAVFVDMGGVGTGIGAGGEGIEAYAICGCGPFWVDHGHGHGRFRDCDDDSGRCSGSHAALRARGTSGPRVRAAPSSVVGSLPQEAVRRVVLRNIGQIDHCYEQTLERYPDERGRVVLRFVIGPEGDVLGSAVSDSSLEESETGHCMANAVRRWQFPAPDGGALVTVNYPFDLRPAE